MGKPLNPMKLYGTLIANHPKYAIILIILITVGLSVFAAQVQFSSNEDDFQPSNEVSLANAFVLDEFGGQSQTVTAIIEGRDNSLSLDSLLLQLELETGILAIEPQLELKGTTTQPYGITSVANLIAQASYIASLFEYSNSIQMNNSSSTDDAILLPDDIISSIQYLTPEKMMSILRGETLTFYINDSPVTIDFDVYSPSDLSMLFETSPYSGVLDYLLSTDYNKDEGYASMSIVSISFESMPTLEEEIAIRDTAETIDLDNQIRITGDNIIENEIDEASGKNIAIIMSMALVSVILILFFIYRSLVDVLVNISALMMAITWVFGIGKLLNYSFNPAITTVPVLIIGLGIDYGIHYNMRYREEIRKDKDIKEAIAVSAGTVGVAILLTTVTTLLGFLSNAISDVASIRQFGILCSIGIVSSFFVMLTFFPAVKVLLDSRKKALGMQLVKKGHTRDKGWGLSKHPNPKDKEIVDASGVCAINNGLGIGAIIAKKPIAVIIVIALISAVGAYEGSQLETRFDFRDFLPSGLEITDTTNILFDNFNFSNEEGYILLKGDVASADVFNGLKETEYISSKSGYVVDPGRIISPYSLALSLATSSSFVYDPRIGDVWSLHIDKDGNGEIDSDVTDNDIVTLYNALVQYYPERAMMILHASGGTYDAAVIRIPVNSKEGVLAEGVTNDLIDASLALEQLEGPQLDVVVTGGPPVQYEVLKSINSSQIRSVLLTIVISLLILSSLYIYYRRSFMLGMITLLPLLLVIMWTTGSMRLLGIPLNVVTVTIAAISVGIGIDYSIHITQRFLEDSAHIECVDCALCVSVNHTGSALFGSALTTVIGFGLLSFSIIPPLAQFGKVTALSIAFAFLASVIVLPTFIRLWYVHGMRKKKSGHTPPHYKAFINDDTQK